MDRLRELEVEAEDKREKVKAVLSAARAGKRALTSEERDQAASITAELEDLSATIRAERTLLDFDRSGAVAVDRPDGDGAELGEQDLPALALPPLPKRTRAKLQAMAGPRLSADQRTAHFGAVVRAAYGGNPFDPALLPMAATGNEAVGSEGGFAVMEQIASDIFTRAAEASVFARIGARIEIMTSDTKTIIALDDDDESSDKEAGFTAGWSGESTDPTPQLMLLRRIEMAALKLMVVAAVTNELADDSVPDLMAQYENAISSAIGKKFDRSLVSGTGAGQPLGLLNSPATVTVAKTVDGDPGTANTFTFRHAAGMWSRLAPGSHERAYWLMHPTVLPQALTMKVVVMNVAATENVGGFQPASAFTAGGPTGYMLMGRPVVITGRVKALSSAGDVILCDPSQIAIGIRRSIVVDRSPHVYFTSDRLALRGKFRGNAMPLWEQPRTLQEGSTTVSPYVILAAR